MCFAGFYWLTWGEIIYIKKMVSINIWHYILLGFDFPSFGKWLAGNSSLCFISSFTSPSHIFKIFTPYILSIFASYHFSNPPSHLVFAFLNSFLFIQFYLFKSQTFWMFLYSHEEAPSHVQIMHCKFSFKQLFGILLKLISHI